MAFPTIFHQLEVVEEVRLMGASQEEGAAPNPAVASHPRPSQPFPMLSHKSCAVPSCPAGRETPRSPTHLMGVTSNAGTALAGVPGGALVTKPEADPCLLQREGRESSRECRTSPYYFPPQPRLGASSTAGINNRA